MQQVTRIGDQPRPASSRRVRISQGPKFRTGDPATGSREKRDPMAELNERLAQPVGMSQSW